MGNKCHSQQPHVPALHANLGPMFKNIYRMDLLEFISQNSLRNWCSTSIFFLVHDINGKQSPLSTAPHPSYVRQLWSEVPEHLVDGFGTLCFIKIPLDLVFHLHILPRP